MGAIGRLSWLSAIDLSTWLALAGIIITALAVLGAYHIAFRQGIFRKPRLFAQFSPPERAEPAVMVLNLRGKEQRSQIVNIYFYLQNLGQIPITNITMQFNLYPRRDIANLSQHFGPMYQSLFPGEGGRVSAMENRDIVEYRIPTLAPDGECGIVLPYLITREADRSGELSGIITVDLAYDQGRRIRKGLYICISENIDVKDDAALSPILKRLAEGEGPFRLLLLDVVYNAIFRIPLIRIPWLVTEVRTTPVSKSLAVQTEAIKKEEPTIYEGTFQMHLGGWRKVISLLFAQWPFVMWTVVLLILLALGRTIAELVLGTPLW